MSQNLEPQLVCCVGRVGKLVCPVTAWVERVPPRTDLLSSPSAWGVVSETVYQAIPDWLVCLNHHLLGHWDEQHIRYKPFTAEIFRSETLGLVYGRPMMVEPVRQSFGAVASFNFLSRPRTVLHREAEP
jgi:hypothetical protein